MDILSNILESIKLKGIAYRKLVLMGPWGIACQPGPYVQFWRLLKGTCFITVGTEQPVELQPGNLALLPQRLPFTITEAKNSRCLAMAEYIQSRRNGTPLFSEGENETVLLGGHFEFEHTPVHPLISGLPGLIHITGIKGKEHTWLQQTADMILSEVSNENQGSRIMVSRLSEALFIHAIRAYLAESTKAQGFLAALADERITKALNLLQDHPEKEWTLEALAKEAGMSRTLFFNKFKQTVGETPLVYLTNWRIAKAKQLLLGSRESIGAIALQVGYQSEAAFNRLFKAKLNDTPANYRRSRVG